MDELIVISTEDDLVSSEALAWSDNSHVVMGGRSYYEFEATFTEGEILTTEPEDDETGMSSSVSTAPSMSTASTLDGDPLSVDGYRYLTIIPIIFFTFVRKRWKRSVT
ncbi:MAG: hypothetical protein IH840_14590 [Candidatus Heimdallarchaeota archaeon]|nr:hypothetical protein [Candidatus Heimdallarchaeota archaeon]